MPEFSAHEAQFMDILHIGRNIRLLRRIGGISLVPSGTYGNSISKLAETLLAKNPNLYKRRKREKSSNDQEILRVILTRIEKGEERPTAEILRALAQHFRVDSRLLIQPELLNGVAGFLVGRNNNKATYDEWVERLENTVKLGEREFTNLLKKDDPKKKVSEKSEDVLRADELSYLKKEVLPKLNSKQSYDLIENHLDMLRRRDFLRRSFFFVVGLLGWPGLSKLLASQGQNSKIPAPAVHQKPEIVWLVSSEAYQRLAELLQKHLRRTKAYKDFDIHVFGVPTGTYLSVAKNWQYQPPGGSPCRVSVCMVNQPDRLALCSKRVPPETYGSLQLHPRGIRAFTVDQKGSLSAIPFILQNSFIFYDREEYQKMTNLDLREQPLRYDQFEEIDKKARKELRGRLFDIPRTSDADGLVTDLLTTGLNQVGKLPFAYGALLDEKCDDQVDREYFLKVIWEGLQGSHKNFSSLERPIDFKTAIDGIKAMELLFKEERYVRLTAWLSWTSVLTPPKKGRFGLLISDNPSEGNWGLATADDFEILCAALHELYRDEEFYRNLLLIDLIPAWSRPVEGMTALKETDVHPLLSDGINTQVVKAALGEACVHCFADLKNCFCGTRHREAVKERVPWRVLKSYPEFMGQSKSILDALRFGKVNPDQAFNQFSKIVDSVYSPA